MRAMKPQNADRAEERRVRSHRGRRAGPRSLLRDERDIRLAVLAAVTALLVPLVGCGDDEDGGTGPDGMASFQAVVTDDAGTAGSAIAARGPEARGSVSSSADIQGSFSGEAMVQVSADGQTWVDLGSMESVQVTLQSGEEATIHASAEVPARTYTRVRLVMRSAEATVLAGSTIDAGPISADVSVDVAGGSEFTIEKQVSVDADAGATTTLVFDLNSEAWLDQAAVDAQSAAAAQVSSATSVRIR